jgi:hypothetical protein
MSFSTSGCVLPRSGPKYGEVPPVTPNFGPQKPAKTRQQGPNRVVDKFVRFPAYNNSRLIGLLNTKRQQTTCKTQKIQKFFIPKLSILVGINKNESGNTSVDKILAVRRRIGKNGIYLSPRITIGIHGHLN